MDLKQLTLEKLRALGAEKEAIPGAKLANALRFEIADAGINLKETLRSQGLTFKGFLRTVPDVVVIEHERGDVDVALGTNAVEGKSNKEISATSTVPQIRKDVYEAFTRAERDPYRYYLDRDLFSHVDIANAPYVSVPLLALSDLVASRKAFAESIGDETVRSALLDALAKPKPLKGFQDTAREYKVESAWQLYQTVRIRKTAISWAAHSNIVVRQSWFEPGAPPTRDVAALIRSRLAEDKNVSSLRAVLDRLSDEELRTLMIPMRYVERLLGR